MNEIKESQRLFEEIQKLQTSDGFTKELHDLIIKYAEVLNVEQKGKIFSDEHKLKLRGRIFSAAHKLKLGIAAKRRCKKFK